MSQVLKKINYQDFKGKLLIFICNVHFTELNILQLLPEKCPFFSDVRIIQVSKLKRSRLMLNEWSQFLLPIFLEKKILKVNSP